MIRRIALLSAVLTAAAFTPAIAHHSAAMFDNKKEVSFTGTVVQLQWANPHVYLEVDVPKDGGGVTAWSVEFPAGPAALSRSGWRKNTVKPGRPSRSG